MAPSSGAPAGRALRKTKNPTASTHIHRYESFTKRISRLKIDPVHTVERRKPSNVDTDLTQSFFRTALDEWSELNLSQTFTSFLNKVNPLSENLPQLLHHADTIFDLLVQHIEKKDELALEPLLSLLAHLAHDIGQRFEQYFSRTVVLVADVAATHSSAEVIEWCFTCLAWLFKYLLRLLVQDLRPLLDIMTPYLSAKKEYIVRFSAESLAFLLRKAAVLYQKRKAPLNLAIKHLLKGLIRDEDPAKLYSYRNGVMSLCVESARGLDGQLHSSAESLFRCLLDVATPLSGEPEVRATVEGIVIALVHETNSTGFQPVLDVVIDFVRERGVSSDPSQVLFAVRLITVAIGTRRGTRISSWTALTEAFLTIGENAAQRANDETQIKQELITISAGISQFAPMDQLLPFSQKLLDFVANQFSIREFFAFCTICADLGKERFTDLVLPRLQQYIIRHWRDDEVCVYYLLETLRQTDAISNGRSSSGALSCPEFEASVLHELSASTATDTNLPVEQFAGRVHLPVNLRHPSDLKIVTALLGTYRSLIVDALKETDGEPDICRRVMLGWGLETYLEFLPEGDSGISELVSIVLRTSPLHFRLPSFLHGSIRLLRKASKPTESQRRNLESVRNVLIDNLLSTSSSLKEGSLEMLALLAESDKKEELAESTDLMLEILRTPYLPAEVRKIAMLLRRLPPRQQKLVSDASYQNMTPFFCLGLLSHYHDQTRKEVCNVLAQMTDPASVEEFIINVAIQWLRTPSSVDHADGAKPEQPIQRSSAFDCTNLMHMDALSTKQLQQFHQAKDQLRGVVERAHQMENVRTPANGRTLALQLLSAIPASAERRSRLLVPIFLAAPMNRGQQQQQKPSSDSSTSSHTLSPDVDDSEWTLPERKALLTLFGKFINPRVLFRSGELRDKLVDLLSNGNAEIRKLALQAVLTWKDPALVRLEKTLLDVAEDKISTTDLGALLSAEEDQSTISPDDRDTVFPILLRLVFGLIVGRAGTVGSQEARRKSILRTLFRMRESEVATFLDIALGKLKEVKIAGSGIDHIGADSHFVPEDQQYGFLRLLLSMLETLQSRFAPYGPQVVDAVVFCLVRASRQGPPGAPASAPSSSLARSIRRTAFQCLVLLFEHCESIDWPSYLPVLFSNAISPRLETFASEANQGISGLLRLFASWVHSNDQIGYLRAYDDRVPSTLWQCLTTPSAQNETKTFILQEIVVPWVTMADDQSISPNKAAEVLQEEANGLLKALTVILERTPSKEILSAVTTILPKLAPFATSSESRQSAISLLITLLADANRKVPPNVKGQLLASIHSFVETSGDLIDEKSHKDLYELASSLFNYFKDESNRQVLCQILDCLSRSNPSLEQAARFCHALNAISTERLEEIDYDRRLQAFGEINALEVGEQNKAIWRPIVFNLLFFVRTMEDFSIRSNALSSLKQFIVKAAESGCSDLEDLTRTAILPVVKKNITHESELIRADFVSLFGLLVQYVRDDPDLENLRPLLVGGDEEASFFSNILHIQQHRRVRAIRRLVSEVEKGAINAQNNADIFIPLLEMFVYDPSTDESAQTTKGQSIAAMATLLQWINWKHFKTLFRRYRNDIDKTDSAQKPASRLLSHAADALLVAKAQQSGIPDENGEKAVPYLARSIRDKDVVENELRTHFIPKLAELVHYKDETEISFRIPIAVTTIKLIKMLPQEEVQLLAAPIMLDIAQILKSRTQESRDVARRALCEIVTLLGPSSLQFVLKEIRSTLTRGYQLHVVSYTLHSILVAITPHIELGDLDYCLDDLVLVVMDDIFGAVGQEKENQDYISSMKEVKSSKSYDSMELLARSTSVGALMKLVAPIQTILSGTLTSKQVRQVDELLRRIGIGLSQNPATSKRDLLVFAYHLIQSLYRQKQNDTTAEKSLTLEERSRQRYLIQLSSAHKTSSGQTSPLLYKLARFALDLVRSTLQKHDDVLTPENVHGFLPIIGDAIIEGQEDVKISALRLLSAIIKLPMTELDENAPLYVSEAVKLVKNSTNTNEEAAQAALKLVAAVLRERKSVKIRDSDIADLLHRITPDIEEPDRQGVTFNFIRAVMARKIQLPELYELVDKIGIMMVTNQTKSARDVARGVYVHFLLEYPQSSTRWTKQQKFLMKNLEYAYPEGRQSVMEAINTLVAKVKGEPAQDLISTFYIPIMLRMANDDNKGCRELAGVLLGQLFRSADRSHLRGLLEPLQTWSEQEDNQALQKISLQAYSILLSTGAALDQEEIAHIRDRLAKILQTPVAEDGDDWEILFQGLLLLARFVEAHPDMVLTQKQARLWSFVWKLLNHPNVWVQSTCTSLIQEFFRHCASSDQTKLPLTCDHGLRLGKEEFLAILKASVRTLRRTQGNEDLSMNTVQNLVFMAQCLDVNGLTMEVADKDDNTARETGAQSDTDSDEEEEETKTKQIPAIHYLLDQMARILRVETSRLTSAALTPKISALVFLSTVIPALSMESLAGQRVHHILLPLQHLTDPNTIQPRSADPTFPTTYARLIEMAHEVVDKLQTKLGDTEYVKVLTEVSKMMRQRREERRSKRRIERVADPEKAARDKRRKGERKKQRTREIGQAHRNRRRELGL
ncbi:U3 snoRNP protein [Exophiala dermatitidis]|uniref:Uncharacterized protein n=2 Tax=Exophiala dermatitidis TaxID=5970 RepID=H6CAI2_EXODN|nr:uncharacterized protein HMPREF1120_08118 [Exophiala dermatitidis NIH/UT8656]KAJ4503580.1 U3 snoRNP protein [Exophiala dermatitidis]EHY60146.1 hypothetical protein HMPREF1120_08118 [Exophiala dermatitidis NIH/UT8656]KAJ4504608.1 U3 snoRNP protein [Exophiala dermatitidis]KAJ4505308.1 U3 snoRNP protein [Exophiala dermatitidis]KAJ4530707.1 U3 snoRNP protein [Exophiala dermatitidis]